MAKIAVTTSNTTITPDYPGSRAYMCFYYDSGLKSVVMITGSDSLLLSRDNVKTMITELKKHYEGMA